VTQNPMHSSRKIACKTAFAGSLLACLSFAEGAAAEVTLVEKDGWTFFADGRVGAFLSVATGDDFPEPTEPAPGPDPTMPSPNPTHQLMGANKGVAQPGGFGYQSNYQQDADNKFFSMRIRSGLVSNVLAFGLKRAITDTTSVRGYIAIWAPIESLGRDKWYAITADLREGYLTMEGPWGAVTAGRMNPLLARMSYEVDVKYGHGFGVGLPCTDDIGPTCGQAGVGSLHPGYGAGVVYSTPSLGGLRLHAGVFDPVRMIGGSALGGLAYERVPMLRPEGALTFETPLGDAGLIKVGVEGMYQPLSRVEEEDTDNDPATPDVPVETKDKLWGVSGGLRLEVGPARIGAGFFHGAGLGLYTALHSTNASGGPGIETDPTTGAFSLDQTHPVIRKFTGFHGQLAGVFGPLQVGVGGGMATVGRIPSDSINTGLSAGKNHVGISLAAYYHVTDSVVIGADYMRFMANWYGAPEVLTDPATGDEIITGNFLAAEKQTLNFINAGVTYHW
jgi:hypothetical protein